MNVELMKIDSEELSPRNCFVSIFFGDAKWGLEYYVFSDRVDLVVVNQASHWNIE